MARFDSPESTLFLVDLSSFIFRAFYAIRSLSNRAGEPTNAVYGVATMLAKLIDDAKPTYLAAVFDSKEPSFRKEVYPEYKANRSAPPEELLPQFDRIEQLVGAMGLPGYRKSGIEADDLIAALAKRWLESDPGHRVVIVTGDKDLMQLVSDRVVVWDTMNDRTFGPGEVTEKFGVGPERVRDYLALVGDSSDNVPGVGGIGPKGAVELLKEHGDLEGVLRAAESGAIPGKKGDALRTQAREARLSAELVTLKDDVAVDAAPERLEYRFTLTPPLADFLREMDFHTLLRKWSGALPAASAPPGGAAAASGAVHGDFRTISTEAELSRALEAIEKAGEFGVDLETTSLNPRQAELVGVALCYDRAFGCYVPVGHRGTHHPQLSAKLVMERLKPLLENPRVKKIGQNLKYDFSVLRTQGLRPDGIGADTMVAAYVLQPEGRHNLEALAAQYLGYGVTTYEEVCGKGKNQIGFDQVPVELATRYSAEDAWACVRLWDVLRPRLEEERLMEVFATIDLPLVDILSRMELAGVAIDAAWLEKLSKEFERELRSIEERIGAHTKGPINLNSPKQLAKLLFEDLALPTQSRTKTGFSTDAAVLEALGPLHEVPRLLLEYREIAKLKGTYVDPLPGLRDPVTGRIHTSYHQAVAATGRLSSSDPNLQNIPIRTERGRRIRRAFVPSEGSVLVSADYSQIELRILAHMSGDPELVGSFQKGEDVHRRTAREIFGVTSAQVDDRQRGIAKAINFGLMYGKTPFGLSQELKIPQKEAKEIIDRYFQRYSGVKRFLDGLILDARERGWTTTLSGRKRVLPDIRSKNPAVRANAERIAMNTPIQGTAADLMKLAMAEVDHRLEREGFRCRMIMQVHDELVLECPKGEAEEAGRALVTAMEGAMKLSVPLVVNRSAGADWSEL